MIGCCGKVTFQSRGDAKIYARAVKKANRPGVSRLRPYECRSHPGVWHLTSGQKTGRRKG